MNHFGKSASLAMALTASALAGSTPDIMLNEVANGTSERVGNTLATPTATNTESQVDWVWSAPIVLLLSAGVTGWFALQEKKCVIPVKSNTFTSWGR